MNKDISLWTADDVVAWLGTIGYHRYGDNFKENDITGKHLLELTKADLQNDLKILPLGHRMDIVKEIDKLKQGANNKITKVPSIVVVEAPTVAVPEEEHSTEEKEHIVVLTQLIAKGSFGNVWLGRWKPNEEEQYTECAVKIVNVMDVHPHTLKRIREEINILKRLDHANIVKYFGHSERPQELHIYMEYFPLSLHQLFLQRKRKFSWLSVVEIHEIALRVAEGLKYLHELLPPVIHRDIKSKNILVKLNEAGSISKVALCDFGVSKQISESTMANTYLGTFRWISPEVLAKRGEAYTKQTDIWSYGMVIYELLTLRAPYFDIVESYSALILNGIPPHIPPNVSTRAHSFYIKLMHQCLQLEPTKRPNASEIIVQLQRVEEQMKALVLDGSMIGETGSTIDNEADPKEALMLTTGSQLRSSGALAIPQQYQSSWAVIIGIESYENPEIPPVACAVNDAKAMEKALSTMGFQTICLLNKEATKEAIEEMLGDILKWKVSINDRVCVFFACHWRSESTSGSEDDIYLLPYNCKPSKLFSSAIHIDRLKSFTKQIPVRHLLFVIDACVSKRARIQLGKGDEVESHTSTSAAVLEELMRNPAVQVITAGFKGQQCHIGKENSIFTEMFVQGINGAAFAYDCGTASNQHSWISVDELATWLQKTVSEQTQDTQFPQYEQLDFGTGSFIFMNPNTSATTEKTLTEEEDENVEVPYISPPKAVPITVIFAPPVLQNAREGRCLENKFFELDTERKALLSTLRRTNTFLQVRVEYLRTESDLRKLGQLEGILQISDYSQMDRTELEEGELNEDESHCFTLEDEFGQLFPVSQEYLSGLMIVVQEPLKLVIVHSPNALKIAMAFLKVGIQHVICILKAEIAANFESVFYKSLLSDNASVRKCFEQAKNSLPTSFWAFVHYYENDDKLGDTSLWPSLPTGAAELLNPAKKANFSKPEIFVGRNEEVKSIINAVLQQRIVAVTGGPGVGKTAVCTIASNYLNKCRYFCDGVFLVDLRDIQPSAVPFRVGSVFGMSINTEEELYLEVAERDSLIILDGCDYLLQHDNNLDFRKLLSMLLKRTRYLKILLTSRQELNISIDNEVVFQPFTIKISELASEEATYLVSKIAPSLGQYCSRVAELFGNLPLAIHAAKMFINQERTLQSPQEIVDLLEKQMEYDMQSMQLDDEFKQVKLSIESSYNTLSTELQELLLVLTLFPSTFDCESIASIVDSTSKEMKDLLRKLLIYNLLDLEQHNRYVLHGLVRTLLAKKKAERGEEFERKWMLRYLDYYLKVLQMANQDYILGNETGLKLFDKERHNIENAMSVANVMSEEFYCNYALSGDHIFCARISPADRIPIYEKCVNIARKNKNSIDEATFLCSLAYAFERSGEYARAEALYTQGLKIREAKLGSSHVTVAEVLKDLALLYSNPIYKQDLQQAEKLFIRTLEIREKVHGPRHPETGKSLAHLATYYRNQQKYTKSEELYARALRVLRDRLGTDCIYVARVLNNQGQLYFITSKETEAEAKFLQSIRIMRKLAHPDRAQPLCNLANLYRKQQKFIQAELLYKEALQVREAAKETFACAQVWYSLGLANLHSKKYTEAEYNIEKALKIYDLYLGRSHNLFLKTRNKLENVYLTQNKTKEAEELRQKWDVKKRILNALITDNSFIYTFWFEIKHKSSDGQTKISQLI